MDPDAPSAVTYRTATAEDIDKLREFEQHIVAAERPYDPTLKAGRVQYYDIERMINSEDVRFIIAEHHGSPVACGFARIDSAKPYLAYVREAYLGLICVDAAYRGQSISRGIIDQLKLWRRSKDVMEVWLMVYSDNSAAVRAYEKAGFAKYVTEMRLDLDVSPPTPVN